MPEPQDILITLLVATLAGLLVIAWASLARRRLTALEVIAYGALALLVPGLGPFLVLAYPPRRRRAERARLQAARLGFEQTVTLPKPRKRI
ncbi:MAG: hypothetical protein EPO32_07805 [Anaerolineae bacterium]|nr:MAG: hypothetical protein EPO32_07805 [Anaerolineae bacterium]